LLLKEPREFVKKFALISVEPLSPEGERGSKMGF